MDLNFIYGRSYSNLQEECITAIKTNINDINIDKVLVITSEEYKREVEIGIKSNNIIDSELKVQINTIKELYSSVISNLGDKRFIILNEEEEFALLTYSLNKVKDKLNLYKNLTLDRSFIQAIKDTITTFKREQVTIDILESKLKHLKNESTKDKLNDFIIIFKEYISNLNNKYLDNEDKLDYAIRLLKENKYSQNNSIQIYKLHNASKQELDFIYILSKGSRNVNIFSKNDSFNRLPNNSSGAFFKTDLLNLHLNKLFSKENNITINNKYIDNNIHSIELWHLEQNLFNYPYSEYTDKTTDIFLTECSSIEHEVENLIESIEYLKNNKINLNSITVAVSNIPIYERTINKLFDRYGIPYSINTSKHITSHPFIHLLEMLLQLYEDQDKQTFLKFIKTGYTSLKIENICILEQYIYNNNFNLINEIDINELIELNFSQQEELTTLLERLNDTFSHYSTTSTFIDFYKSTFNFIESSKIITLLQERICDEFSIKNESETLQVWQNIIKKLDYYSNVLDNKDISSDIFIFLLNNILANLKISQNTYNSGVNIKPISNIKEGSDILFILGVNEGIFPPKLSHKTIFTDMDILDLNSVELLLEEDTISMALLEQFNTYNLLTSAERKLFISYSLVGKDLTVMKKSPIINRIKQLFPMVQHCGLLCSTKEHNSILKYESNLNRFKTINKIISEIHLLDKEQKTKLIYKLESLMKSENYSTYIDYLISALTYNNKVKCNDKYILQSLYYSDTLSVSKLEKYAKCPFSYFIEYGLKIKEDTSTSLQAKHIGTAIHSLIEHFDLRLKKSNKSWNNIDNNYINSEIDSIISYLEKRKSFDIFNSSESAKYYKNKLKELAKTSITTLTNHIGNSFFECLGHEISFDDKGTYPPIRIKLPSGKRLNLRGSIDRLDLVKINNTKFIRIVDYKTGNTTLDLTEVINGTQLQLLTYLDAIISSGKENEYLPAGVFYFKVDDPYVKITPDTSDDYITENKLKELRMKGLFINNENLIQQMDKGIYDGKYNTSLNIQAKFKTDGMLSKSTPGISIHDLDILRKYTNKMIKELAFKMLVEGDISIKPIRKKSIDACTYCKYRSICQFDESLEFNSFKQLIELSEDEAINIARKKEEGSYE